MTETPELTRDEIEALLVFLANDTLEGPERAVVEAAVAEDPQLAGELEALKAMRGEMQAQTGMPSPGELGLARLMRDIDAETPSSNVPEAANSPTAPSGFWKIAAVVLFGLVVAQTAFFGYDRGSNVRLAGGEEAAQTYEHTLRVSFVPDATEGQIRQVLLDQQLVIIDGPSALGLYTLGALDAAQKDSALAALSNATDVVESVE